ncbi:hypothetical protein [Nannocystis punicea]|uniref:Uncharacterized protein n=1 Tax=Nannocystis punicea TaxID=2995304 RepID=A0ABY7GW02_9BACT|nr:hypothetical protein [Nannocystis poenicansa]WAS91154.1 hypothetical protein O0S08_33625 [Nannocystis poenicansa]
MLAARVDDANAGKIPKRKLDVAVASAWGDRVCAALGWEIVELRYRGGGVVVNVLVSPDRRYSIDLESYARRVLRLGPGAGPNTLQLLFSMLRDGSVLPPAPAGSYTELG